MLRLRDIRLKPRLLMLFLVVGIVPLVLVSVLPSLRPQTALMDSSTAQIRAHRDVKGAQIESYFRERGGDMTVPAAAVQSLRKSAFNKLSAVQDPRANAVESYLDQNEVSRSIIVPGGNVHDAMQDIVRSRTGLGATGETCLVEKVNGRYFLRGDTVTMGGGQYVFAFDVTAILPEYLGRAHEGRSGRDLSTHSGGRWGLLHDERVRVRILRSLPYPP